MAALPPGQEPGPGSTLEDTPMECPADDASSSTGLQWPAIGEILATTRAPWNQRMAAMAQVETLLRDAPPTAEELAALLQQPLAVQLRDLRSQVVQKSCGLVTALTQVPTLATATSSWFLEALLENTAKTVGVIAGSSASALRCVCIAGADARATGIIVHRMTDKHRAIRRAATEALFLLLEGQAELQQAEEDAMAEGPTQEDFTAEGWTAARQEMYQSLCRTLVDPEPEVRFASRMCAVAVRRRRLPGWESFWTALEPNTQQQVEDSEATYGTLADKTAPLEYPAASKRPLGFKRHRLPGPPAVAVETGEGVCLVPAKKSRSPSKPDEADAGEPNAAPQMERDQRPLSPSAGAAPSL
eukprot:GGOE01041181.1.p1 GENE.GGOE01041181.1~~GGOE01041181.1.p1  ORF type:complete len:365 (+),score=95.94 GGOE01041181.1:23-1096(+)